MNTTQPNSSPYATNDSVVDHTTIFRRRLIFAPIVTLLTLLMAIALFTYDWHDISWLSNPINAPLANKIGALGAWMTFFGYNLGGLAYRYFALPLMVVLSFCLWHGHIRYFRLKCIWMILFYTCIACLFQIIKASPDASQALLIQLNLRPNAGGAIGQFLATDCLIPLLGTLGSQLLLWPLTLLLALLLLGIRSIMLFILTCTSPVKPSALTDEDESVCEALRTANSNRSTTLETSPPEPSFFSRIFHRKQVSSNQDEANLLTALAHRATTPPPSATPSWFPGKQASEEPLFEPEKKATEAVQPTAKPIPEDFALSNNKPSILKPVAPERAVTAPAPVVNARSQEEPALVFDDYTFPSVQLLDPIPPQVVGTDDVAASIEAIESVFQQFNIAAHVVNQIQGPVLTQFEIKPEPGVKVEKFSAYENNLLMALRAESIRIQAPIPGRDVVGIEVPNTTRQSVTLRDVLEGDVWKRAERKMALPLALGKLATGGDLVVDLAEMPHLLVAGGTGSGKSVSVNDMLIGLLMCRKPEQLRLLMVDPKRVEFTFYDDLPHLLNPVVVEPKKVLFSLRWAVVEMNNRYKLLQQFGVRNIGDYNRRVDAPLAGRDNPATKLPYIVIVIDELAELMLTVKADIEPSITSLTQKARAAGIHMIIATQRPTTDIITGTIKANIPGRLALRVTQSNDSRTILDEPGAENLIGKGDMLLARSGKATVRSQAAWVSDSEIVRVCEFIKEQSGPAFDHALSSNMERIKEDVGQANDLESALVAIAPEAAPKDTLAMPSEEDDKSDEGYYKKALELIRQTGRFSVSSMQRRLAIGYNKAGRIADMLEDRGIIGPQCGNGAREILVDLNAMAREAVAGTDGEASVPDTRTATDSMDVPEESIEQAVPEMSDTTPAEDDTFDIDFDPDALEVPNSNP